MNQYYHIAYLIAKLAHLGQVDKTGVNYFLHPLTVSSYCTSEIAKIVALLHDVLEDTIVTRQELEAIFPREIMEPLIYLTHEKNVDYYEYVENLKGNPIATEVKLADLKHNSDPVRLSKLDEATRNRLIKKYQKAKEILQQK